MNSRNQSLSIKILPTNYLPIAPKLTSKNCASEIGALIIVLPNSASYANIFLQKKKNETTSPLHFKNVTIPPFLKIGLNAEISITLELNGVLIQRTRTRTRLTRKTRAGPLSIISGGFVEFPWYSETVSVLSHSVCLPSPSIAQPQPENRTIAQVHTQARMHTCTHALKVAHVVPSASRP